MAVAPEIALLVRQLSVLTSPVVSWGRLNRFTLILACAIALLPVLGWSQAPATSMLDLATLERRVEATLSDKRLSESDKKQTVNELKLAIDSLGEAERLDTEAARYSQDVTDLASEHARLAQALKNYQLPQVSAQLRKAEPAFIEQRYFEAQGQAAGRRAALAALRAKIKIERTTDLPALINESQQAIAQAGGVARESLTDELSGSIATASALARRAQLRFQQAKAAALRQRLASRPARLTLMEAQAALLVEQVGGATVYEQAVQSLLSKRNQAGTDGLIEELTLLARQAAAQSPAIESLARGNLEHARALAKLYEQREQTDQRSLSARSDVSTLETKFDSLNRLLELNQFETSPVFGAALRREWDRTAQRVNLDAVEISSGQALTASRVALFDLEAGVAPYDLPSFSSAQINVSDEAAGLISRLTSLRRSLVVELTDTHTEQVNALSALLGQLHYYTDRSVSYTELLKSYLFWIPSAQVFGVTSLDAVENSLNWLTAGSRWQDVALAVKHTVFSRPLRTAAELLLVVLILVVRKPIKKQLAAMKPLIGKVKTDQFRLTISAVILTAVLAAPPALVMAILADLTARSIGFTGSLSVALLAGSLLLFFLEFMLQCVRANGLADLHFRWNPDTLYLLKHNNRWLITVFVPSAVVMVLLDHQAPPEIRDGLGRVALVVLCIALSLMAYRLGKSYRKNRESAQLPPKRWFQVHAGNPILIFFPLLLAALSLLGYHYTAGELLALTLRSIILATIAVLVYNILERGFSVYERRLALERLIERRSSASARSADRDAAEKAGEGMPEFVDTQFVDRQMITSQSKTLLRLIVGFALIAQLFYVWQDLLPVARSLNEWVIWRVSAADVNQPAQLITMWNLLIAGAVLIGAVLAIRNLPGTLEVAVLSRLNLTPGTGYAITTVSKYLVVFIGIVMAANLLGTDWSKLQWLIAALSVGLGFGLQEIVANFVSGIVILFERPFRLGDTITIDNQIGTVTRIQTRATTISDWDRKEIIIPNKTFITGQFINWTLSDSITRLIIPVGVAFRSDTDKVVATLTEVALSHEAVLTEPPPAVLFVGFGPSSFDFELRVFTRSIIERIILTHKLHMAIDKAFKANGIRIAYPQQDVHIDTTTVNRVIPDWPTGAR